MELKEKNVLVEERGTSSMGQSTTDHELESLVKQEEEFKNMNLIEKIHADYGYGWITWKIIFVAFMNMLASGFCRAFLAVFVIPMKEYFDIGDGAVEWIAFSFLIASAAGMFIYAPIQRFGRWININVLTGLLLGSHLLLFNHSLTIFIISRLIMGFASGLLAPISYNILVESVPAQRRGFVLNAIWLGYGMGLTLPLAIMLGTMPNLEAADLQKTYLVLIFIPVIGVLVNLFVLKDSPRNLILQGHYDEAFGTLEKMKNEPISEYERSLIIKQVTSGANTRKGNNQLVDIATRYKVLTFVLAIVTILIYISFHGTFILLSMSLKELQPGSTDKKFDGFKVTLDQLIICIIKEFYVFFGFLTEVKYLGRIGTMQLSLCFSVIVLILFLIFPSMGTLLLGLYSAANNLTYTLFFMYTAEVYPTTVRDLSNVIFKSFGSLAGAASQIICLELNEYGVFVPYYFVSVLLLVCIITLLFVPFETQGVQLDTLEEKKAQEKKKS